MIGRNRAVLVWSIVYWDTRDNYRIMVYLPSLIQIMQISSSGLNSTPTLSKSYIYTYLYIGDLRHIMTVPSHIDNRCIRIGRGGGYATNSHPRHLYNSGGRIPRNAWHHVAAARPISDWGRHLDCSLLVVGYPAGNTRANDRPSRQSRNGV